MSDDIDLAQQHEEMHRANAIAAALERPRRMNAPSVARTLPRWSRGA